MIVYNREQSDINMQPKKTGVLPAAQASAAQASAVLSLAVRMSTASTTAQSIAELEAMVNAILMALETARAANSASSVSVISAPGQHAWGNSSVSSTSKATILQQSSNGGDEYVIVHAGARQSIPHMSSNEILTGRDVGMERYFLSLGFRIDDSIECVYHYVSLAGQWINVLVCWGDTHFISSNYELNDWSHTEF